ncbi:hypothetical protein ES705_24501 [subsurface metagenome]
MSSGLVIINAAVCSDTTFLRASISGHPLSSGQIIIILYPFTLGAAAAEGWENVVVIISSLLSSSPRDL